MYLSELLGRRLKDSWGRPAGHLRDVVVRVAGDELPEVVALLIRRQRRDWSLPIAQVYGLDGRTPTVTLEHAHQVENSRRPGEVHLGHDVLDKQVIDLHDPRVVRVNDIVLVQSEESWQVRGIDIGLRSLVARLLPDALRSHSVEGYLLPWAEFELLASEAPTTGISPDHQRLAHLHPADIARIADAVPLRLANEIVASLDDALAADAVEEMIDERQADVIEALDPSRAADILAAMAPDAAADVLAELEPELVADLLRRMGTTKAADLHALLTYPKDTAGGLMTTDYVMAPRGLPIGEATGYLRPQMLKPDWVYYIYVVEDTRERRLVGVLSLRDLFLADPTQSVDDLMAPAPRQVRPDAPATTVAQIMSEYNLTALPVTSEQGLLLGIVSVDDALEVVLPADLRRRLPRVFS